MASLLDKNKKMVSQSTNTEPNIEEILADCDNIDSAEVKAMLEMEERLNEKIEENQILRGEIQSKDEQLKWAL